jgi:hypothetical protein
VKFRITLKDPDGVFDGIDAAATDSVEGLDLPPEERDILRAHRQKTLDNFVDQWVECGEYIDIEFDTDAKTARVVPKNERK